MKIAIDCSPLAKTRTGIGTYTFNLIKSLSKIDSENEYYLFAHRNFDFGAELASNFIQIKPKREFTRSTPWLFRSLPKELRRNKIDIFHGTNFLIPPNSGCKTISTVHDLSSLTMPSRHSFLHKISHSLFLKSSLKRADRL
ncbi:glycosyltransferase, partial [bacterium]|nr:glycosyltransferase [bacterium]